jgi:hypothetical protein
MSILQNLGVVTAQNGKSFASGTLVPADEDVDVVSGLSTVDHCGVSLAATPSATHQDCSAVPGSTAGTVRILTWEPDHTVAATPVAVTWWAVGNR